MTGPRWPSEMASLRLTEAADFTSIPASVRVLLTASATARRVCSSWLVGGDAQLVDPLRLPHGGGEALGCGVHAAAVAPFLGDADDAPGGGLAADDQLHGVAGARCRGRCCCG